jgi:AraC-like DNA-binding protein
MPAKRLSRAIAEDLGENFSAYLNRKRAESAAVQLVEARDKPITTIMYDAGFGSKSAFQREFMRCFGMNPSEYRRTRADQASSSTSQ